MRMDRRTYRTDEGNSRFSQICERAEKYPESQLKFQFVPHSKHILLYMKQPINFKKGYDFFWAVFANIPKSAISFAMPACLSVRPHRTTRLPLDGLS
jgi:hypothetical protein